MMIQTTVLDLSKRSVLEYTPPNHAIGEQWPGPERVPTKQLTLFEVCSSKQKPQTVVVVATGAPPRTDGDASEDEEWFSSVKS
jgi:hypothetical protein